MATKTLLAAVAAVTMMTGAAQAQERSWLNTPDWMVWQSQINQAGAVCFMKHLEPTSAGTTAFGFYQNETRSMGQFFYIEDGWTWTQGGRATIEIDRMGPWTVNATPGTGNNNTMVTVPLNGGNVDKFVNEIAGGYELRITTLNGTRTFSLAGSGQAVATLHNCMTSITASHQAPQAPVYTPLPAPRYAPLPRPVRPTGPATPDLML